MAILLNLAAVVVGAVLITRAHSVTTAGSSNASPLVGAGVSCNCMNVVSPYFLGFALAIGGLVIMMLALFAMSWRERGERRASVRPAVHHLSDREEGSLRDVA
jgi:ABC-type transport system involved in cytochrome c biogenesis permease subunit